MEIRRIASSSGYCEDLMVNSKALGTAIGSQAPGKCWPLLLNLVLFPQGNTNVLRSLKKKKKVIDCWLGDNENPSWNTFQGASFGKYPQKQSGIIEQRWSHLMPPEHSAIKKNDQSQSKPIFLCPDIYATCWEQKVFINKTSWQQKNYLLKCSYWENK